LRTFKLLGKSDGIINSSKLGFCEHCGDLPKGSQYYANDGVSCCKRCLETILTVDQIKIINKSKKKINLPNEKELYATLEFNKKLLKIEIDYYIENKKEKQKTLLTVGKKEYIVQDASIFKTIQLALNENKLSINENTIIKKHSQIKNRVLSTLITKLKKQVKEQKPRETIAIKNEMHIYSCSNKKDIEIMIYIYCFQDTQELSHILVSHDIDNKKKQDTIKKESINSFMMNLLKNTKIKKWSYVLDVEAYGKEKESLDQVLNLGLNNLIKKFNMDRI
jgi:hypothetical protein